MKTMEKKREEIVAEYLAGEESYRELETRYGISTSTLQRWVQAGVRQTREGGETITGGVERTEEGVSDASQPWSELKRLRSELRRAELHNKLLNAMIDIAEDQMGVKIRKKPGARQ
jgi:transposase-like protein